MKDSEDASVTSGSIIQKKVPLPSASSSPSTCGLCSLGIDKKLSEGASTIQPAVTLTLGKRWPSTSTSTCLKSSLDHLKDNIEGFTNYLRTQLRASLYTSSVNDHQHVKIALENLLHRSSSFAGQTALGFKDVTLKVSALTQKVTTLEYYTSHLCKEKSALSEKVLKLEKTIQNMAMDKMSNESDIDLEEALSSIAEVKQGDENVEEPQSKKQKTLDQVEGE